MTSCTPCTPCIADGTLRILDVSFGGGNGGPPAVVCSTSIQVHAYTIGTNCVSIIGSGSGFVVRVTPNNATLSSVTINGATSPAVVDTGVDVVVGGTTYRKWNVSTVGIHANGGVTLTLVMTDSCGNSYTETPTDHCVNYNGTDCQFPPFNYDRFQGLLPFGKSLISIDSLAFSTPTSFWCVAVAEDLSGTNTKLFSYCGPPASSWDATALAALATVAPLPYACTFNPSITGCDFFVFSDTSACTTLTVTYT